MKEGAAVFASGRGSNALSLFSVLTSLGVRPLLFSNYRDAPIIEKAKNSEFIDKRDIFILTGQIAKFELRTLEILKDLKGLKISYIFLAGFMRILSANFLEELAKSKVKVVNIHPSPLPLFKGLDAYEKAFHRSLSCWGVSTHFVSPDLDGGELIAQSIVRRMPRETFFTFLQRGLEIEHKLYARTARYLLS